MISKHIPDLPSSPMHLCYILASKKVVEKHKSKKRHSSHMYDDFHSHLVGTNSNTQEPNMHGKVKGIYPYIYTEEMKRLSKHSDFTSMKSMKDMDASINWRSYAPLHTY